MYRNILQSIEDIEKWPVIGLIIFFVFFIVVLVRVFRTDKKFDEKMKNLPLEDSAKEVNENS